MSTNALPGPDINNPDRSFSNPLAVVDSEELTRGMKVFALDRWELVAQRSSDVRLLDEIAQARELLALRYDASVPPRRLALFE